MRHHFVNGAQESDFVSASEELQLCYNRRRQRQTCCAQRTKNFHNFSFPPPLCTILPTGCQRKEPLRVYPLPFLNSHDFAASGPSPPAFNRGYENQAACSLFIFSDLLCVLPAARAVAFPNTGHRSELRVLPGLMREVRESAAKLSLCKKIKVEASPRFMVLVFEVLVFFLPLQGRDQLQGTRHFRTQGS